MTLLFQFQEASKFHAFFWHNRVKRCHNFPNICHWHNWDEAVRFKVLFSLADEVFVLIRDFERASKDSHKGGENMLSVIDNTLSLLRTFGTKMEVDAHDVPSAGASRQKWYSSFAGMLKGKAGLIACKKVFNHVSLADPNINGDLLKEQSPKRAHGCGEIHRSKLVDRYYHASIQHLDTDDEMLGCVLDMID